MVLRRAAVSVRFKILQVDAEGTLPASRDARSRGCTCPLQENRGGGGWAVSDNDALRGFWIAEDCEIHRTLADS
jgi:hypothetical protein